MILYPRKEDIYVHVHYSTYSYYSCYIEVPPGRFQSYIVYFNSYNTFRDSRVTIGSDDWIDTRILYFFNRLMGLFRLDEGLYLFPFAIYKVPRFHGKWILLEMNENAFGKIVKHPRVSVTEDAGRTSDCERSYDYFCHTILKDRFRFEPASSLYVVELTKEKQNIPEFFVLKKYLGKKYRKYNNDLVMVKVRYKDGGNRIVTEFIKESIVFNNISYEILVIPLYDACSTLKEVQKRIKAGRRVLSRQAIHVILKFRIPVDNDKFERIYGIY
jgi:hypothetical protein